MPSGGTCRASWEARISASVLDVDGFKLCNDGLRACRGRSSRCWPTPCSSLYLGHLLSHRRDEFVVISVDTAGEEQRALVDDALARFPLQCLRSEDQIDGRPHGVRRNRPWVRGRASDVDDLLPCRQSMYRMKRRRELRARATRISGARK